jgi:hypothetical protein
MEEDIKVLEEFIEYSQGMIDDMEYERPVDVTIYKDDLQAIKNLIARNKELEKENKILKANGFRQGLYEKDCNYISKSVINEIFDKHIRDIMGETCWEGNTVQQLDKRQRDLIDLKEELLKKE